MAWEGDGLTTSLAKRIQIDASSDYSFGSGNFTIYTCWRTDNNAKLTISRDSAAAERMWWVGGLAGGLQRILIFQNAAATKYWYFTSNSNCIPNITTWFWVFCVRTGSTITFRVNGVDFATTMTSVGTPGAFGTMVDIPASVLVLGGRNMSTYDGFDGYFAEAAIWNRALSADEMDSIYKSKNRNILQVANKGLMGYWRCDEFGQSGKALAGGGTILDHSGRGHAGTPLNIPPARQDPLGYPPEGMLDLM